MTDSFNLLSNYRPPVTHTISQDVGGKQLGTDVQFNQVRGTGQQREAIAGTDGKLGLMIRVTIFNALDTSIYSALMGQIYKHFRLP